MSAYTDALGVPVHPSAPLCPPAHACDTNSKGHVAEVSRCLQPMLKLFPNALRAGTVLLVEGVLDNWQHAQERRPLSWQVRCSEHSMRDAQLGSAASLLLSCCLTVIS